MKKNNEYSKNIETKWEENEALHKQDLEYKTKMY